MGCVNNEFFGNYSKFISGVNPVFILMKNFVSVIFLQLNLAKESLDQ